MSIEETVELLSNSRAQRVSQRVSTLHEQISLGGAEPMRSMMKSCLALWASRFRAAEVRNDRYDAARKMALTGELTGEERLDDKQYFEVQNFRSLSRLGKRGG